MSYSVSRRFAEAKTRIFWDLKDFPISTELDPDLMYSNIKSALEKKGYRGDVSIRLYGDKNTLPPNDELIGKYERAGFRIILIPEVAGVEYAFARNDQIALDVLLSELENPEKVNFMVLADVKELMSVNYIFAMHGRGHNVLLVDLRSDFKGRRSQSAPWLLEIFSDVLSGSSQHVDKEQKRADEG